jgi:hypothetical protein
VRGPADVCSADPGAQPDRLQIRRAHPIPAHVPVGTAGREHPPLAQREPHTLVLATLRRR